MDIGAGSVQLDTSATIDITDSLAETNTVDRGLGTPADEDMEPEGENGRLWQLHVW